MRRLRGPLGILFVVASLLALGLVNAPVAQGATAQVVSGRAVDASGQPLANVLVQLFELGADPSQEAPMTSVHTDGTGTFAINAPTPADINPYSLVLGWGSDFGPVVAAINVAVGSDLAKGDIPLHLIHATGRVLDASGQPVKGVKVSSYVWSGGTWEWFSGNETTVTDAAGNYKVQIRPLVEFTVRFDITDVSWAYLGGSSDEPVPGDPATTHEGPLADVAGLDVVLPETHKLSVHLATPYGETVAGGTVALYAVNHQPGDDILFSLDEGASGSFAADVPPGAYDIVVDTTDSSPKVQPYTGKVTLGHADLNLGTVALDLADPSISGSVYDKYGAPMAGAAATRLAGATSSGPFAAEGAVLQTRADGGFGWSVSHPWNKVGIALSGCTTVLTVPVDVSGGSVSDRAIRLDCPTTPVPITTRPTITGTPFVGTTLTAVLVALPPLYSSAGLQWLRDGVEIPTATGPTYVVNDADHGHELTLRQTIQHDPLEGFGGSVTFVPFSLVSAGAVLPLESAPIPKISGKASIGSTLTAKPGTWAPSPVPLKFQWLRSGTAIPGATASTYKVQKADAGATMVVRVTAAKAGYERAVRESVATAKVPFLKLTAGKATISGTARVGKTLKANKGKWKPSGIHFSYQWFVSGAPVAAATKSSYHPVAADKGKTVTVAITGSKVGYKTVTKTSKATRKVT